MNVNLRLLQATIEFLLWVDGLDGVVCTVSVEVVMCCVVIGVVTIQPY